MPDRNNLDKKYYQNEYLFSEIYLQEITQNPEKEEIHASLNTLKEYHDYADTTTLKEWKDSFIHQVLYALGFNVKVKNDNLTLLFPMGEASNPISLVFCLLPDEDLDNTTMGRNWSENIMRNLREHNIQWGLLTNGEKWRVYHNDEPTPYETYLEIDLSSILENLAYDDFQIFYKFMRVENFIEIEDSRCQFDIFKKESQDKINYIENELENAMKQKEEGGQGVLSSLCMGYVEYMRQNGITNFDDEERRRKIYHGAMLYLFRLLFLYYADSRGLLSDKNHDLLTDIRQRAHDIMHKGDPNSDSYQLWNDLETIFVDIDQTYNGGLFNPHESEFTYFIEESKLYNTYLASSIYHLAFYNEASGEERAVSYKDMSVRHLGTLYEGLLEHKLFIAKEDTEIRTSKSNLKFIPLSKGGKPIQGKYIPEGQVYFGTDVNERKSSGSYYTPEYIVDYIVSKTLEDKLGKLFKKYTQDQYNNYEFYQNAIDANEKNQFAQLLKEETQKFVINNILTIKILDPAMGSGHFLVKAANLLSNFVTRITNHFKVATSLDTSTEHWRRWVVENCIFGVDINPLAVELAKLSLWILTMAKNKPLSFLKHHLKVGNSLISASLDVIGIYPLSKGSKENSQIKQISLFKSDQIFRNAVEKVIKNYSLIRTEETLDLNSVENKKKWLDEINKVLKDFKAVCSLHTSLYYDLSLDENQYQNIVDNKTVPNIILNEISTKNYFHWELEFPEVFLQGDGFDFVVGNPPYDTFKENDYFKKEKGSGCRNLFGHFIIKAISLNKFGGSIGFIVPLSIGCGISFEHIRQTIYRNYRFLYASHYSKRPNMLFDDVQQRITIFTAHLKSNSSSCHVYSSRLWRWEKEDQEFVVHNPGYSFVDKISSGVIPKVGSEVGAEIYRHIKKAPKKLSDLILKNSQNDFFAYYHSVAMYWVKAYDFLPYFKRENESSPSVSSKLKTVAFSSNHDKDLFILLLNSSLFYYWWIASGDEFDVRVFEINGFGLYGYKTFIQYHKKISILVSELMDDYHRNSEIKSTSLGGKKSYYQEFYPRQSRHIINRIDDFIAPIYGLTEVQNQFLKDYDLIWRTDQD